MYAKLYMEVCCFDVMSLAVSPGLVLGMKHWYKGGRNISRKLVSQCACSACLKRRRSTADYCIEDFHSPLMLTQVMRRGDGRRNAVATQKFQATRNAKERGGGVAGMISGGATCFFSQKHKSLERKILGNCCSENNKFRRVTQMAWSAENL